MMYRMEAVEAEGKSTRRAGQLAMLLLAGAKPTH